MSVSIYNIPLADQQKVGFLLEQLLVISLGKMEKNKCTIYNERRYASLYKGDKGRKKKEEGIERGRKYIALTIWNNYYMRMHWQ